MVASTAPPRICCAGMLRCGRARCCLWRSISKLIKSGGFNNGEATDYGFGWGVEPSNNVVEHWGAWEGFVTHVRRDLMQNTLLVTLSNLGPASTTDPICEALAAFVGRMNWSGATQPG